MQVVLEQNFIAENVVTTVDNDFGKKIGVFVSLIGCWHKNLTRPFTNANQSYRACLHCGARRKFDPNKFTSFGTFYYPPTISQVPDKR